MSEPAAREHEAPLTTEVLGDVWFLLRRLADADRDHARLLWDDFGNQHPELTTHLVVCGKDRNGKQEHDLIIEQRDGAFLLRFCPDRGLPWAAYHLEDIADNILMCVGTQSVSFQSALHWMRLTGSLDGLLDGLVNAAVLRQSALKNGITLGDDEVQAGVDEFRRRHSLLTAEASQQWLRKNKMSVEDLQDYVERLLLYEKTRRRVTEGRIDGYFSEHRREFDLALLAHLVVAEQADAQRILEQVQKRPSDWAKLAREHSLDRETAETGGWLGLRPRSELAEDIADAVFAAAPGSLVGPLMNAERWEILRVENLRPAVLDERTREAVRDTLFRAWLGEQRAQTAVRWYWEPSSAL